ncbi:hypothetical protein OHA45_27630 [Streptomyces lydicus]|uniref:hypothetical protein n=1 Tax=Streptomyces lydicus TaxID=47763 RepID=UPI002E327173|nr:hypothetical protein [Streptomyces lydicus]
MSLTNPYAGVGGPGGRWYKGSLHAHSDTAEMYPGSTHNEEDKPRSAAAVLQTYKDAGYDFVVLAEQNEYTTQSDIGRIPQPPGGIIVIPGAELDGGRVSTNQHLSHVNPSDDTNFHVKPGERLPLVDIVDRAKDDPQRYDKDPTKPRQLITQLHPQFPREPDGHEKNILGSRKVGALEIVNSWWMQRPHAFEDSSGKYSPFAFHLWDRLLKPIERNEPCNKVWGVAGCCSVAERDVGVSWIKVWLDKGITPSADSLMDAIGAGRFYVSSVSTKRDPNKPPGPNNPPNSYQNATGVEIDEVKIGPNGTGVTIKTNATHVYAIVDGSPRLKVPNGTAAGTFTTAFPFPDPDGHGDHFPDAKYIRFECVGPGDDWDTSYDWDNTQQLNRSWTQPIWVN